MNKESAGDDLGLTLQTGFVTKALVGLFGSDRFRLAVSADGSTFFDGIIVPPLEAYPADQRGTIEEQQRAYQPEATAPAVVPARDRA
jgi:hypothetical protein